MARLFAPLAGVLIALCACQDTEQAPSAPLTGEPSDPNVLARFAGGDITVSDIDAHILRLPLDERPAMGAALDAWYDSLIRTLVVDQVLLSQANEAGLQQSREFRLRRIAIERQWAVQSCLENVAPESIRVSGEALQDAYAEREEQFQAPERRSVFHIFLREEPGVEQDTLEAQARVLRERILRGESFERVARAESASQSRHLDGSIGWIVRGQLPSAFEELIFSLDEGVPSQPIATPQGVHLFQVNDVLPARQLSRQEALPRLRDQLEAEKVAATLAEIAIANPSPTVSMVDRETLEQLIAQGAEQEAVLVAGDYSLSLQEFRQRLGRVLGDESASMDGLIGAIPDDVAWQFLGRLYQHEAAYEHCSDNDLIAQQAVSEHLESWEQQALVSRMRQRLLREQVMDDGERLELYYQSNIGQFTPPVQWDIRRLSIPFDGADMGSARMARLEEAAQSTGMALETLQQDLGGEVESLGWMTLPQMQRIDSRLSRLISPLGDGNLSAPLRIGDQLHLYQVMGKKEFEPRAFEQVRDAVISAYVRQYTSEIYARLEAELLESVGFELFPERLNQLRDPGTPADITVEQLDALLSES